MLQLFLSRPARALSLVIVVFAGVCVEARAAELRISEIRIDQPGPDRDEFFELAGAADAPLDGLWYLVIGDGPGGSGVIESVIPLTGHRLDETGIFAAGGIDGRPGSPGFDVRLDLHFENADNVTHLVVRDFRGTLGEDLDFEDDGHLDLEPWSEVLDAVALVASDPDLAGDRIYCVARIGPDRGFVPAHVYRDTGGWVMGRYDLRIADTPGRANPDLGVDPTRQRHQRDDDDRPTRRAGARVSR